MQGSCNINNAKTYLSMQKPVALCLQECRIHQENKNTFNHKLYNTHILEPDLVTFIRKDVKSALLPAIQISEVSQLSVRIEGEDTQIMLNNLYSKYM